MDTAVDVLGFAVAPITMAQAVERVSEMMARRRGQIVTANAEILYTASTESRLADVVRQADLVIADGMGVVWAARINGHRLPERVSGYDLLHQLCRHAAERGHSVYLLGGAPGVADAAADALQKLYPSLAVAGTHHGFFSVTDNAEVLERIDRARPDMLFLALGLRGEYWISEHKSQLPCPAMQVGGSFDILAGRALRAPQWMQKTGLEWAFRLWREPKRVVRMAALPLFMWKVVVRRIMP